MTEILSKLAGKTIYFVLTFFMLYLFSLYFGLRIIDSVIKNETAHVVRFFAYGTIIASIISFVGTIVLHIIYRYIVNARNFAPWFRTVNLFFLYGSGLYSAIGAMKGFLTSNSIVTGYENIFDDRFGLIVIVFFVGLFNYTAYQSIVLSEPREIPVIEWFIEMWVRTKEYFRKLMGDHQNSKRNI
ncbi:hypothetical protein [Paenibacillus sp. HB172176]|uniref:hypothetical protein n=1 Tax=Paenibacillus sp. HB172176 TaxID=2493690 RepID=UPI00143BAE63|nr:hypothetical protein [Paenibacillus sp. HB172176]